MSAADPSRHASATELHLQTHTYVHTYFIIACFHDDIALGQFLAFISTQKTKKQKKKIERKLNGNATMALPLTATVAVGRAVTLPGPA